MLKQQNEAPKRGITTEHRRNACLNASACSGSKTRRRSASASASCPSPASQSQSFTSAPVKEAATPKQPSQPSHYSLPAAAPVHEDDSEQSLAAKVRPYVSITVHTHAQADLPAIISHPSRTHYPTQTSRPPHPSVPAEPSRPAEETSEEIFSPRLTRPIPEAEELAEEGNLQPHQRAQR